MLDKINLSNNAHFNVSKNKHNLRYHRFLQIMNTNAIFRGRIQYQESKLYKTKSHLNDEKERFMK